ncbi:MAG: GntR family transcriptional regulator [Armatimonadota bacterium]|nr:GntR family transcriptional regulator [Armatimonadota bacterium]MDR7428196.1 GntR family transcriptional regulator [Armatimonadota bacterium]MDR7469604.1 GntR family transcriptional regulator [Armatimonadota bacterium]MDR7475788.1 GntR family transcriptional regulator [Armatimonadota bacterium]MDR7538324.1 GntR family transcriptional regulator [Armatimonadota bacterium]
MASEVDQLARLKKLYERDGLRGEVVYRTLRDAIVRGVLPEGYRLQDRVLANALQVSRTPVREAMQRLESEGFVETTARQGVVVSSITAQDVEDIYVIRIALEGVAARLAAQRASSAEIELLARLNDQFAAAVRRRDLQAITSLNREFHGALYQATRNRRLAALLNTLHDSVQRFRRSTLSVPERAEASVAEHEELIQAIRARDADRAEALARAHKERAKLVRLAIYQQPVASKR